VTPGDIARLSVGVIGPGRVGTALALALADAGHPVVAVAGRAGTGDAAVSRFAAAVPACRVTTPSGVVAAADLVLLTVGDDALPTVVRELAADDAVRPGVHMVHTSGRYGADVLRPAALAGARVAACHPAQTFPTPAAGRRDLPGTAWAVTAASRNRAWAHALVARLGGEAVDVREVDRVRYHAALSVGANGTIAVVMLARDLLLTAGIAEPGRFLTPLVTRSASNAAEHGAAALTGPVRRGDRATVEAHLADLGVVLPEAVQAYRALARLALSYARRAGLDEERAAAIRTILDAE
jgi:predicted short-subunit dehydrogenase-like oxidoreductase (DUF2520 family)